MHAVGAHGPDTLAETVAARLRGYLAERRISHKEFGELVGWDRGKYQRRLSGEVALDLADLEDIERNTGLSVTFLVTGIDNMPPKPPAIYSVPSRQENRVVPIRPIEPDVAPESDIVDDAAARYIAMAEQLSEPILPPNQPTHRWSSSRGLAA